MEASIRSLASTYLTGVRPTGSDGLRAACPLCQSKRAFIISLSHGGWICWSCGERGPLVVLLRALGMSAKQVDRFVKNLDSLPELSEKTKRRIRARSRGKSSGDAQLIPEYILGAYSDIPEELLRDGFSEEILVQYEVGVDLLHDRIVFPIRDNLGRLVSLSGRARNNYTIPRYKVYDAAPPRGPDNSGAGELYGIVEGYSPRNRDHLYGFNEVYPERYFSKEKNQPPLVITEGYKSTLWLKQLGFTHAVGLQGSHATYSQLRMLGRLNGPYYIMLDNEPGKGFPDNYGRCAALDLARKLRQSGKVFVCLYEAEDPIGTAPDDIGSFDRVDKMIDSAETLGQLLTRRHER